jgi:hypothetical protein
MQFYTSHYGSKLNIQRLQTGQLCHYSNLPWTGWSRVQISVNARLSVPVCQAPKANPASWTMSTASPSWRQSGQVSVLTTNLLLVVKLVCGWSYTSTSPSVFKACYSVIHIHKCIYIYIYIYIYRHTHTHTHTNTHSVRGDLKTCAIHINKVRMVTIITDFRKLDISLVSRIMPMLNFTIHLSL